MYTVPRIVLESASHHGVRFLLASTSAVYGNLEPGAVLREDDVHFLGSSAVARLGLRAKQDRL